MKDTTKISNAIHEIRTASKACEVPEYVIHLAKHELKTNDRTAIYEWVKLNKGQRLAIKF